MSKIILSTLNARYIHSSLGLRYLKANMGCLQDDTTILEFNINSRVIDIVENILSNKPDIIGFGVYIWNIEQTTQVVRLIKTIQPAVTIIIGGPEVSYEYQQQVIVQYSDYLLTGQADLAFAELCTSIITGHLPLEKIIQPTKVNLEDIQLPYDYYSAEDIANRIIYVEASRGCPFKCEFCLSSLDKTSWPFDLDRFLQAMQSLYLRGARHFKFVDRTFNLKVDSSLRIMQFFLDKLQDNDIFLHFELIPDHLPDILKAMIARFPQHSLQFEIGIQSLEPTVQKLISRKQDNIKTASNLEWLRHNCNAHIHADLIIGLPGETMETFARGFNQLIAMQPHEIQVGILKRLKGTPIIRHTDEFEFRFNPYPPYNILCNNMIDFATMQRLTRFSRYWDMIANSGRFNHIKGLMLGQSPFENFMKLSDWIYKETGQTHKIALERVFKLVYRGMTEALGLDKEQTEQQLLLDYQRSGIKGNPAFLSSSQPAATARPSNPAQRQKQHNH